MKKPEPTYEKMDVPRLDDEVKSMNGKSTRRLHQCIDKLEHILDDEENNLRSPNYTSKVPKEE